MTAQVDFPTPPRFTSNDPDQNLRSLVEWMWDFFNAAITQGGLIQNIDLGTELEAQYPSLFNLGSLVLVADRLIYTTSATEWAQTEVSAFMRTLLDDADGATAQATLGISAVLSDAELLAIAGLVSAADKLPYFTGSGTAALADFTAYARTLNALANSTLWRTNLGLAIGSDVQAYDAELAALAGLTSAANKAPYFTGSGTAGLLPVGQGAGVTAANDLTLGSDGRYFQVSGATQINRIVSTGWIGGDVIRLKFASTPTVKNGQASGGANKIINLAGAADFSATANDILSLIYDATDAAWYEVARSVN